LQCNKYRKNNAFKWLTQSHYIAFAPLKNEILEGGNQPPEPLTCIPVDQYHVIKDSIGIRNRFLNQLFNENNLVSN
jgi:hypothetical protein